jgi:alcohol dehydrogenase class IV
MTFSYLTPQQKIVCGSDGISRIADEIAALGVARALLVCGATIGGAGLFSQIESRMKGLCVGVFTQVAAHSPLSSCRQLAEIARSLDADAFVTIGGGSASDTAKIAAVLLAEGDEIERHASRFEPPDRFLPVQLHRPKLPIVSIPTTASAAEVTFGAGVRMPDGSKLVVWDPKLAARLIVLDPEAVRGTPWGLLATTAMNGLAHCIEAAYSRLANPISEALALQGARLLHRSILALASGTREDADLLDLLVGASLSGLALSNTRVCIHHAICHGLGGLGGLPHGVANTIILPHAMRFNMQAASAELGRVSGALGAGDNADAAVEAVRHLQQAIGASTRLRDTTLARELLPAIATHVMSERGVYFNPRPIADAGEVLEILEAAW